MLVTLHKSLLTLKFHFLIKIYSYIIFTLYLILNTVLDPSFKNRFGFYDLFQRFLLAL